ncbi:MAG: murein biosynthesis integral membrane protein MurJ [Ktedonobacteraceae bacterium]
MTEAALLLMLAIMASRGLGVVRQVIFNALFGTGAAANAYYAAARLPETLFDLVAGGALIHAFIPVFLSFEKDHGKREAWRLASLVFNVLLVALTSLVLVSEFLAPTFVSKLLVPGYPASTQALTTNLTRIMLLHPLILGLGTVFTALLNGKRQFLLPALSVAIYNVGLIGGLLFSLAFREVGIYGPTYGFVAAAICQAAIMLPGLAKEGVRYSFIWDLRHPGLREVMRLLAPNVLAVVITSTGFIVDTAFISYMPDKASLAAAHNAYLLYAFPLALVTQAIAQAALPQMASLATLGRYVRLRITTIKLVVGALIFTAAASLALYFFGKPMIRLLFQHGAFGKHSSAVTGTALLGYAVALPGMAVAGLLVVSFYALKDARTPMFVNILGFAIRWLLLVLFLRLFTGTHAVLAVPLAAAGVGIVESLLLGSLLYVRMGAKIHTDKGLQRLVRMRNHTNGDHPSVAAELLKGVDERDIASKENL